MPWSPGASRKTSRTCSPWLGATWQAHPSSRAARFRKCYEGSPLGPPFFFLAEDPGSRRYVGMAALFRTTLSIAGEPVPAISAISRSTRSTAGSGPLASQRATLSAIPENGLACAYGSPNPFSSP